jgi:phosphoribosylformylglycinamidine synthase
VDPTPTIGMVGLLDHVDRAVSSHARAAGDVVLVLGATRAELGGSALWEACCGFGAGTPPAVDLAAEARLVEFLVVAASRGLLRSAHDCSHGGLGVALAEVAIGGPYAESGFGLDVDLRAYAALDAHTMLFSESHARAVVTVPAERATATTALAAELGVPVFRAGTVGGRDGAVRIRCTGAEIQHPVADLRRVYFGGIPHRMGD